MRWCGLLLLAVAGCSPYSFAPEVTAFSSGVDKVSQAFDAGYAALATDRVTQEQLELIDARARVVRSPSCLVTVNTNVAGTAAPCVIYPSGGMPSQPSEDEIRLGKAKDAVAALQAYGQALAAVTKAADRSAYDAAVSKLATAVQGIAPAQFGAGLAAGINLVGWVAGEELDYQRFETLRTAVNDVGTAPQGDDPPIKVITDAIGKAMKEVSDHRLTTLNQDLSFDTQQLGPSESETAYRQRLADAESLAASIQALRTADPLAATTALNAAHEALVKAVNDPAKELPALRTALQQFAEKAQTLEASFTASARHAATPSAAAANKGS